MRNKIIAGNWKMNLTKSAALNLLNAFQNTDINSEKMDVSLFAPAVYLDALKANSKGKVNIGAQNFFYEKSGAFTGEISFSHLMDLGIDQVLIGHSERRMIFGETNEMLRAKLDTALANNFKVFFCCGEPESVRDANQQNEYVENQLKESLLHIDSEQLKNVVVAYEPVWAIGTGKTASNEQANDMHIFIRELVGKTFGKEAAEKIQILYGGSCNAANAKGLFSMSDIDGGLIGGASLKEDDFIAIMKAAV